MTDTTTTDTTTTDTQPSALALELAAIVKRARLVRRGSGPEWRKLVAQLARAARWDQRTAERAAMAFTHSPYPATFERFLSGPGAEDRRALAAGEQAPEGAAPLELEPDELALIRALRSVSAPAASREDLEANAARLSELVHTFIHHADAAQARLERSKTPDTGSSGSSESK